MGRDDFGERYETYLPRVLNYMRVRVGDRGLAEDLTATVFARAFAHREELRAEGAFVGWLFRIAHNALAEHFRRERRRGPSISLDDIADDLAAETNPTEAVHRQQELTTMLRAVAGLSAREQDIIGLRFAGGLTNREVAQAMNLSESNVAVILFRALRRLRAELGKDHV